jgi:hypothetical protein
MRIRELPTHSVTKVLKGGSEPALSRLLDSRYIESSIRCPRDESVGTNEECGQAFLILCV